MQNGKRFCFLVEISPQPFLSLSRIVRESL